MSLEDYYVDNDKFEYVDEEFAAVFPCCCCKHRFKQINDLPCSECGNNLDSSLPDKEAP